MTHMRQMDESEGELTQPEKTEVPCRWCGEKEVTHQTWESHDGAYEDSKYECQACGYEWWIDGIDS